MKPSPQSNRMGCGPAAAMGGPAMVVFVAAVLALAPQVRASSFYISATLGDDANTGTSELTPWRTFGPVNALTLSPGDRVLLKRGDVWGEELHLRGKGTAGNHIELSAWGDALLDRPRIVRQDLEFDRCVVIEGPSYWKISAIDCRNAKIGLYLRYEQDYENEDVQIFDCHFQDMTDPTLDPSKHNYEIAWSNGIWLGGRIGGLVGDPNNFRLVLDGLAITDCTFRNCAHGYGNGFYYPEPYNSRVTNLYMADCTAYDCFNGAFALFDTNGGLIERVRSIGGGPPAYVWSGTTMGFAQNCMNVTIDNCLFAFIDRNESADGTGFDFEGSNIDCTFSNSVVYNCSGGGMLSLATGGFNQNISYTGNVFFNNAQNPWNDEINSEMVCGASGNTGTVSNNGFYRKDAGVPYFSSFWDGHTVTGNRLLEYGDVNDRAVWWNWQNDGDLEGWGNFNHWPSPTVSGGALRGTASGDDPFVEGPPTWSPVLLTPYVWVRMSQTAGIAGQIFYLTESDPVWNAEKSQFFFIEADGQMRDYFVDLRPSGAKGVITRVRLDPTVVTDSQMVIEHVRIVPRIDTRQGPPAPLPAVAQSLTFLSRASEDGWVLESGGGTGVGGSNNASSTVIRLGDAGTNGAYRAFYSFDTSALPDGAYIDSATMKFTRVGLVGADPWTYGGSLVEADRCTADIAARFGTSPLLENGDWQATADADAVAWYIVAFSNGLQVWDLLDQRGLDAVNKTGLTQFRVRFLTDTNGDNGDDYINVATAAYGGGTQAPELVVRYFDSVPPAEPPLAPGDPAVEGLTETALTFRWTDNSWNEDGFRVRLNTSPTEVAADSTGWSATGLDPNALNLLTVTAYNDDGESAATPNLNVWTLAATPLEPFTGVATEHTIAIAVRLDANPAITEYAIEVEQSGLFVQADGTLGAGKLWRTLADWDVVIVNGLEPDTEYTFRSIARNGAGVETAPGPGATARTTEVPPTGTQGWGRYE